MRRLTALHVPFVAGQTDKIAPQLLPTGLFERIVNGRYRADGALALRRGYEPLTMAGLDAFDLYGYGDTIYAAASSGESSATDLVALTPSSTWRALSGGATALPQGTDVQRLHGMPFPGDNAGSGWVAESGGLVAAALSAFADGTRTTRVLHVIDAATSTIILKASDELTGTTNLAWGAVVPLSTGNFGWLRYNVSTGVMTLSIADVTTGVLGAPTTLFSDGNANVRPMVRSDATRIHILYRNASNAMFYRQFTHAGVENGTGKTVQAAVSAATKFTLVVSATQVHTVLQTSSTNLQLLSFGIGSPYTTATGPTNITTTSILATECIDAVFNTGSNEIWIMYCIAGGGGGGGVTDSSIVLATRSVTHVAGATVQYDQYNLIGGMALVGTEVLALVRHVAWRLDSPDIGYGAMSVLRLGASASASASAFQAQPLLVEERQIARFTAAGGNFGFNIAPSASGNAYAYFLSSYQVSAGAQHTLLRRMRLNSPDRRPGAVLGGLLYLAGGVPLVTDGQQIVESGMPPPDLEEESQGTSGSLTQGGVYKYRAHYEWHDSLGNKHLSPASQEVEVTLTGTNDEVSLRSQAPPSFRVFAPDVSSGSAPTLKLFRTETNVTGEPASRSSAGVTPADIANIPAYEADPAKKLTLTVDAGAPVTVTLGALTSLEDIAATIEAQVPTVTVTVVGGTMTISTISVGPSAFLDIGPSTFTPNVRNLLNLSVVAAHGFDSDAAAGELFFLTEQIQASFTPGANTYAPYVSVGDTRADSDLIDKETIYTTGDRGAVSGVLDFAPPLPAAYVVALKDRLVFAGKNELVQISQRLFPNEAVAFADPTLVGPVGFAYQARVEGEITGLAAVGDAIIVGTRDDLWIIGGEGPNYVGIGEFNPPQRLPADAGFYDWRSIVNTPEGLWFQGDLDKLYMLAGGAPVLDEAPRTRLGGFISGAACTEGDVPVVAFAVGDAARLVVRDLTNKQWMEDALPQVPARSFIEHRGRFYFARSNGDVWRERTSGASLYRDDAAVYPLTITTGTLAPFEMQGWGRLGGIDVLASAVEASAAATLQLEISYDDGLTYTSLGTQSVSGLAAGAQVRVEFTPAVQKTDRFKLRFTMTPTASGPGLALHGFTLYVRPKQGGPRFAANQRQQ